MAGQSLTAATAPLFVVHNPGRKISLSLSGKMDKEKRGKRRHFGKAGPGKENPGPGEGKTIPGIGKIITGKK